MRPLSFVIAVSVFAVCKSADPVVDLKGYGKIEGLEVVRDTGRTYDTFRGIPYAKAPTGDLRFEKPVDAEPWSDVLEAKQFGSPCFPLSTFEFMKYPIPYSEDCLNLNVFRPKQQSNEKGGYPVMVWIHGGGFTVGSSIEYGFENILDAYVSKGIVFVAMHYRLNLLGFFQLNDKSSLGNYGLWDQTQALKWVHNNIAAFGGDPNRVTIFGESAGGASVAIQSIVKHSRDYVYGAIAMSGGPKCTWAAVPSSFNSGSRKLAELVGCPLSEDTDVKTVMDCMKKVPIEKFQQVEKQNKFFTEPPNGLAMFGPHEDGDYFHKSIAELIAESPDIPTIVGVTELEGGCFATPPFPIPLPLVVDMSKEFTEELFFEKSISFLKGIPTRFGGYSDELLKMLVKFKYVDTHHRPLTEECYLRLYSKLLSDVMFNTDTIDFAMRKRQAGSTVYFYQFDYFSPTAFPPEHKNKGAYHGTDLRSTFNVSVFFPAPDGPDDNAMAATVITLLTDFAKYGNPTPNPVMGTAWNPQSDTKPLQYLSIATKLEMKDSLDGEWSKTLRTPTMEFWRSFVPGLAGYAKKCPYAEAGKKCPHALSKEDEEGHAAGGCPFAHKEL